MDKLQQVNRILCSFLGMWRVTNWQLMVYDRGSLPADIRWDSLVTHSFLPDGEKWNEKCPWGRNECVTNEPQRMSAGRLMIRVPSLSSGNLIGYSWGRDCVSLTLPSCVVYNHMLKYWGFCDTSGHTLYLNHIFISNLDKALYFRYHVLGVVVVCVEYNNHCGYMASNRSRFSKH